MVAECIRLLNQLLRLALVDDASSSDETLREDGLVRAGFGATVQDWSSKRCHYI